MMVCDNRPGWVRPLTDAQVADRLAVRDGQRQHIIDVDNVDLSLHQPGFRLADQASRDKLRLARQEMIDRARSGWLTDKRRPPDDDPDDPDDPDEDDLDREDRRSADSRSLADIRAGAIKAREAWVRSLSDAWRTPAAPWRRAKPHVRPSQRRYGASHGRCRWPGERRSWACGDAERRGCSGRSAGEAG
jgi:hypothetical protein